MNKDQATVIHPTIHPTAIVSDGAIVGEGCSVGPYCIIGPHVKLGAGCTLHSHVVLEGRTTIGKENEFFQFCSVGAVPQDLKYHGEPSELLIGDHNTIREYVTLQPGTEGGGMVTRIGSKNLFMANAHVGHDSIVGDGNILANSVGVSGHVTLGSNIVVGGLVGIHQFVRLGDLSFIAGGAMITQDIPPYCLAHGNRAELIGLNQIGLKRAGWSSDEMAKMRKVYRSVLLGEGTLKSRLEKLQQEHAGSDQLAGFLDFVASSERGVAKARLRSDS